MPLPPSAGFRTHAGWSFNRVHGATIKADLARQKHQSGEKSAAPSGWPVHALPCMSISSITQRRRSMAFISPASQRAGQNERDDGKESVQRQPRLVSSGQPIGKRGLSREPAAQRVMKKERRADQTLGAPGWSALPRVARLDTHHCWPLASNHLVGAFPYNTSANTSRKPRSLLAPPGATPRRKPTRQRGAELSQPPPRNARSCDRFSRLNSQISCWSP